MKKSNWYFVAACLSLSQTNELIAACAALLLMVFGFGIYLDGE